MIAGGCHCGAIRYEVEGEAITHAMCHCADCRRHAGAPVVGWTMYPQNAAKVTKGTPKVYASSEHGRRHFCADCGTPLTYEAPDGVALAAGAFDAPAALAPWIQYGIEGKLPFTDALAALPARRTEDDQAAAAFLSRIVSFQHPDHDTPDGPSPAS